MFVPFLIYRRITKTRKFWKSISTSQTSLTTSAASSFTASTTCLWIASTSTLATIRKGQKRSGSSPEWLEHPRRTSIQFRARSGAFTPRRAVHQRVSQNCGSKRHQTEGCEVPFKPCNYNLRVPPSFDSYAAGQLVRYFNGTVPCGILTSAIFLRSKDRERKLFLRVGFLRLEPGHVVRGGSIGGPHLQLTTCRRRRPHRSSGTRPSRPWMSSPSRPMSAPARHSLVVKRSIHI